MSELIQRELRPWGYFEVLSDTATHKVKRIGVSPGKRLSLQRHAHRAELWYVIAGESGVVRIDEQAHPISVEQTYTIPKGSKHRLENTGSNDIIIIEVQTGTYFGEDDIERFEDDFGRAAQ